MNKIILETPYDDKDSFLYILGYIFIELGKISSVQICFCNNHGIPSFPVGIGDDEFPMMVIWFNDAKGFTDCITLKTSYSNDETIQAVDIIKTILDFFDKAVMPEAINDKSKKMLQANLVDSGITFHMFWKK